MTAMEEVAKLRKDIERLQITRARLQERLESEKAEMARLLEEAKELGVPDPKNIAEWVEKQREKFVQEKARVSELIAEAERNL